MNNERIVTMDVALDDIDSSIKEIGNGSSGTITSALNNINQTLKNMGNHAKIEFMISGDNILVSGENPEGDNLFYAEVEGDMYDAILYINDEKIEERLMFKNE